MQETVSVLFSLDELWLLQACVRHELAQAEQWKFPPASLALNDAVAGAILFCEEQTCHEAAVLLNRHDCLVIDYNVPSTAKDPNGKPIGRAVLLKSFRARRELEDGPSLTRQADSAGQEIDAETIRQRLAEQPQGGRSGDHA